MCGQSFQIFTRQMLTKVINMVPLSCSSDNTWEHGNSLINYMKMADINGLTGRIKFDENGLRTDFELEIVELKKHGLDKVDKDYFKSP